MKKTHCPKHDLFEACLEDDLKNQSVNLSRTIELPNLNHALLNVEEDNTSESEAWTSYLDLKYEYFYHFVTSDRTELSSFLSNLKEETKNKLQEFHNRAFCLYVQRVTRINEKKIKETYYSYESSTSNQFLEKWICEIKEILSNFFRSEIKSGFLDLPFIQTTLDEALKIEKYRKKIRCYSSVPTSQYLISDITLNKTRDLYNGIRDLSINYEIQRGGQEREGHNRYIIKNICQSIKKTFSFSKVDFLKKNRDPNGLHSLEVFESTYTFPDQVNSIRGYATGEGISGSVLLIEKNDDILSIGTNDVENDLEASRRHILDWNKAFPRDKLRNYWLFPVFLNNEIYGAVRVINKSSNIKDGLLELTERTEILNFIQSVENFLTETSSYFVGITQEKIHRTMINDESFQLENINFSFSLDLISFLMSTPHIKFEKRSFGISLCITDETVNFNGKNAVVENSSVKIKNLSDTIQCIQYVNFERAIFVFNLEGTYVGCYKIDSLDSFIGNLTKALIICVRSGRAMVNLYNPKGRLADLYTREVDGLWGLRVFDDLLKKILDLDFISSEYQRKSMEQLFEYLWRLSSDKVGSIVIVYNNSLHENNTVYYYGISLENDNSIRGIEYLLFKDLASIDGALIMDNDFNIKKAGYMLPVNNKASFKGARHMSSQEFSKKNNNVLVFTVSENSGISCFFKGKAIFYKE